jgi:toxin ParE1/3/4
MPRVSKQASTEQDLIEIWLYTFNEWGEKQADRYLDDLAVAFVVCVGLWGDFWG